MDAVELPVSVVASIASAALSIGVTWGLTRGRLKALEDKILEYGRTFGELGQRLRIVESFKDKGEEKFIKFEETRAQAIVKDVFDARMDTQDADLGALREDLAQIRSALESKVSKGSVAAMRRVDPREDPTDPPPLGPMRPRLPSRRGPGE